MNKYGCSYIVSISKLNDKEGIMNAIEISSLTKNYKVYEKEEGLNGSIKSLFKRKKVTVNAVKNISFSIKKGERVGFIGPNGAGKTTTLKILSGLMYPTSGHVNVLGYTPWERKAEYLHKIGLVMGQRNQLWWDIPAMDSFILNREIYNIPKKQYDDKLDEMATLLDVKSLLGIPVRNLSLGERMKMEIISSLIHSPQIFYLDEPTIGLDIISQKKLRSFFLEYNKKYNNTILLTSHYLADITSICDRIIVINKGVIVYDGDLADLRKYLDKDKIVKVDFSIIPDASLWQNTNIDLTGSDENSYIFKVNKDYVSTFISTISKYNPNDFVVEDPSIEKLIEKLYREELTDV